MPTHGGTEAPDLDLVSPCVKSQFGRYNGVSRYISVRDPADSGQSVAVTCDRLYLSFCQPRAPHHPDPSHP